MILNAILSALNCKIIFGSIFWPHKNKNPTVDMTASLWQVEVGNDCRAFWGDGSGVMGMS